jgi:hypothetical protein
LPLLMSTDANLPQLKHLGEAPNPCMFGMEDSNHLENQTTVHRVFLLHRGAPRGRG